MKIFIIVVLALVSLAGEAHAHLECRALFDSSLALDAPSSLPAGVPYARADESDVKFGSASFGFWNLSLEHKLLNQTDNAVTDNNLVLPGRGVCGPTCALNLLRTYTEYFQTPLPKSNIELLRHILRVYQETYHQDGRGGADMNLISELIPQLLSQVKISSRILREGGGYRDADLEQHFTNNSALIFARATFANSPEWSHALVLLNVNTEDHTVVYSDPNDPSQPFISHYHMINLTNGRPTLMFDLGAPYGNLGQTVFLNGMSLVTATRTH